MATRIAHRSLSRAKLLLLAGLLVLSSMLFVMGSIVERASSGEGAQAPIQPATTLPAGQEAPEGSEAREAQERQEAAAQQASAEGTVAHEQAEQNTIFGINLESPWVIAGVVLSTLLLLGALVVFGERALLFVSLVMFVALVFDIREVVFQLGEARYAIAALAVGVAVSRLATAIVALLALREGRHAAGTPAAVS